ncbi:hypothetical protein QZH41_004614 [Actinostola sp. cb2023]|nr:hypothetical protein QZH41_004614 [Actinostola sp. cb2023]
MVPLASMKLPWVSEDHFAVPFFDLASCVLQLYINILLGQAQECLLEKSILDGRKDSLIARISMQVYDYYQQALGILESLGSSYLGSKKSKMWTKAVKIKAFHFTCVSYGGSCDPAPCPCAPAPVFLPLCSCPCAPAPVTLPLCSCPCTPAPVTLPL